jgi:uncharacterized RDD family membrane protein YckC
VAIMLDRMSVATPEAVSVTVPLAGLGSRFAAGLIDLTIQVILISIVGWFGSALSNWSDGVARAAWSILVFVVLFFYPVLFELRWAGRTPGKRLNGLRVVTTLGGPVTLRASVIRNLIRLIDFLPAFYGIGMFSLLAGTNQQRLGDAAASTVVTFEPKRLKQKQSPGMLPPVVLPGAEQLASVDVSGVTLEQVTVIRQFLQRRNDLPPGTRATLARRFASPLRTVVHGIPPTLHDEHFLEAVAEIKGQRS